MSTFRTLMSTPKHCISLRRARNEQPIINERLLYFISKFKPNIFGGKMHEHSVFIPLPLEEFNNNNNNSNSKNNNNKNIPSMFVSVKSHMLIGQVIINIQVLVYNFNKIKQIRMACLKY